MLIDGEVNQDWFWENNGSRCVPSNTGRTALRFPEINQKPQAFSFSFKSIGCRDALHLPEVCFRSWHLFLGVLVVWECMCSGCVPHSPGLLSQNIWSGTRKKNSRLCKCCCCSICVCCAPIGSR